MFKQGNEHNQVFSKDCNLKQGFNIFLDCGIYLTNYASVDGADIKYSLI